MAKDLVLRGLLAGLAGGVAAWVLALILAEPLIDQAIGYEEGRGEVEAALSAGTGGSAGMHGGEEELVSRGIQGTLGLGVGMIGLGIAMGLFFSVAYSMLHGRVALRPRALALVLAATGFVAVYATPFLKYPANPPAVGSDETTGDRTALYLIMVIASVVLMIAAGVIAARLAPRLGTFRAVLVGIAGYVVLVGVLMALLPALGQLTINVAENGPRPSEVPLPLTDPSGAIVYPGFDADLLYGFRLYSFLAQALLWAVLGLVFGALAERLTVRSGPATGVTTARASA